MKLNLFFLLFLIPIFTLVKAQNITGANQGQKDNFFRICDDPKDLIKFFQETKFDKNIKEIAKSIPLSLLETGIKVSLRPEAKKIRIGAKYFDVETPVFWNHFEGENQRYWIDIIEFDNKGKSGLLFGSYKSMQLYSGHDMKDGWSFWTSKAAPGLNAIDVLIRHDTYIFNFGLNMPFVIDGDDSPDEKSERIYLGKSIDTLLIIMEKVAKTLVEPGKENSVPRAFPDKNNVRCLRLASFARLWSEVKYNFVFTDRLKELDWEHILDKYLPRIDSAKAYEEYINILKECFALLKDGHTVISGGKNGDKPGIQIQPVEGKPVVTAIGTTAELKASKIKIGMELIEVNGKPADEVLKKDIYPYIFESTSQDRDQRAFEKLLESEPGDKIHATFKDLNGKILEVLLKCNLMKKYDSATWIRSPQPFEYKELEGNLIYVAINSFNSNYIVKQFDKIFDKISDSKGLIIDVRKNGGGSSKFGYDIIAKLIDKRCDQTSKWKTRMYKPASKAWGEKEEWYERTHDVIEPRGEKPFLGPVVVLTGPKTFSAAEDFLIPLKASGRAKLVGMPTGGSTGQPLFVEVFEASASICTKWDRFPDGTEFVGVGVQPDIKVEPTIKSIIEGRDLVLEKGIEVLKKMGK